MRVNIGQWRIRIRWRRRQHWGIWMHNDRYPEGYVYRWALGLWQMTAMVDSMTERERTRAEQRLRETFGWLKET